MHARPLALRDGAGSPSPVPRAPFPSADCFVSFGGNRLSRECDHTPSPASPPGKSPHLGWPRGPHTTRRPAALSRTGSPPRSLHCGHCPLPGLFLRLLSGHLFMDKLRLSPTRQGPGTWPPGARSCRHTLPQSQERKSSHPGRSFRRQQTDPAVILCEVPTTTTRR